MRRFWLAGLLFGAQCVFAQLADDTLTITVTSNTALPADQAVITVVAVTPLNTPLDDVLGALQAVDLKISDVSSASTFTGALPADPKTVWYFNRAVPLANLNQFLATLAGVQKAIESDHPGWDLSYSVAGTQASPESRAAQTCPWPSLVSYAQKEAQQVAAAAAVKLGPVVGLSDIPAGVSVPTAVVRRGDFSQTISGILVSPVLSNFALPPSASCSLTVQFKLVR